MLLMSMDAPHFVQHTNGHERIVRIMLSVGALDVVAAVVMSH